MEKKIGTVHLSKKINNGSAQVAELPVAPEFVDSLQEMAFKTMKEALQALHAPAEVLTLAGDLYDLPYYLLQVHKNPGEFTKKREKRFDIEGIVLETVNAIAACGGVFHGGETISMPRAGSILASGADHNE